MKDAFLWQGSTGGDPFQYAKLLAGDGISISRSGLRTIILSSSGVAMASDLSLVSTSGSTLDFDLSSGDKFKILLDDNITVGLNNPDSGGKYTFIFKQNFGGNTVSFPANVLWPGGTDPVITTASGAIDIITMMYDNFDDVFYASFIQDFF